MNNDVPMEIIKGRNNSDNVYGEDELQMKERTKLPLMYLLKYWPVTYQMNGNKSHCNS